MGGGEVRVLGGRPAGVTTLRVDDGLETRGRLVVVAVEDDLVLVRLPGQHRREHDPVVVAVRLVAEDGDAELLVPAAVEHLLQQRAQDLGVQLEQLGQSVVVVLLGVGVVPRRRVRGVVRCHASTVGRKCLGGIHSCP